MSGAGAITLGVLAGGRGARLGGADKAWMDIGGQPLLQRCLAQFAQEFSEVLVSARSGDQRHAVLGVRPVFDRHDGFRGPVAGLMRTGPADASAGPVRSGCAPRPDR